MNKHGLNSNQIEELRNQHGWNEIKRKKHKTKLEILRETVKDPIIYIMFAAAALSFITGAKEGNFTEAIVISMLILVNISISFFQELKTQKELLKLEEMNEPKSIVIRDGKEQEILSRELLPGDLVKIKYGTICKADMEIIDANNLFADEAFLTGESDLIKKKNGDDIFSNSMIKDGNGLAIVKNIGLETRIGQITKQVDDVETSASQLELKILDITKKLLVVAGVTSAIVFVLALVNKVDLEHSLQMLISILVATVPEGLATVLTIVLTFMGQNLSKNNALIKKVDLLETLGELSFVCSDKTGTITKNNMEVVDVTPYQEDQTTLALMKAVIDKETPTSRAVSEYIDKQETSVLTKIIGQMPFNSSTKKSISLVEANGQKYVVVVGAPDFVAPDNETVSDRIKFLAKDGLRTLLIAYKETTITSLENLQETNKEVENLKLVALFGIQDPPKESSITSVKNLQNAGIKVVMITGDHQETASAIARQVGILSSPEHLVLTGAQLAELSDDEFSKIVRNVRVYARVQPEDKKRIVTMLQSKGEITAMTGDGTNDSIALKKADVGIAMGIAGTDISKEAADLLLLDDNFSTIEKAVHGGRLIFANLRKFMRQMLTSNAAHVGSLLFALIITPFLGKELLLPMTPLLILWVNVISDSIPSLAIGFDHPEGDLMSQKPIDKNESILPKKTIIQILTRGLGLGLMVYIAFTVMVSITGDENYARTTAFVVLSFGQLIHIFDSRSSGTIYRRNIFQSKPILLAVAISSALNLMLIYTPLNQVFGLKPLELHTLIGLIIYSSFLTLLLAGVEYYRTREQYPKK
jgi:Ca2+-transporting ATPase